MNEPELPIRSPEELVHALRDRARYLSPEYWENPATVDMMLEAAHMIEVLLERLKRS